MKYLQILLFFLLTVGTVSAKKDPFEPIGGDKHRHEHYHASTGVTHSHPHRDGHHNDYPVIPEPAAYGAILMAIALTFYLTRRKYVKRTM